MAENRITKTIRDAETDARSLSEFVYKPASFMVSRRLANPIHTLNYYIDEMSKVIKSTGYVLKGDFASGATLDSAYDIIKDSEGVTYRWGGALPKVVNSGSTPQNSGGFAKNAWVEVSDPHLKNTLFSGLKNGNGALKIDGAVSFVASKFDLVEIDDTDLEDGHAVITTNEESLWVLTREVKTPDRNSQVILSSKSGSGTWVRRSGTVKLDTVVTVGGGGHYTSLNEALNHLKNLSSQGTASIRVLLLSGYVLDEQVVISNGTQLGHIQIDSEDEVVLVDIPLPYKYNVGSLIEVGGAITSFGISVFGATYNSELPVINVLFDTMDSQIRRDTSYGVYVSYNSSATILRGAGFIGSGLGAIHGCRVTAAGAKFINASGVALQAFRNSTVDFRDGVADNAGNRGAYCGSSSILEALQASFKNAGSYGIECYGGAKVHCRTTDVSGAKLNGFYCRDGSLISTRNAKFHDIGTQAIYVTNGGTVVCEGSDFKNIGSSVFYAENGASISAYDCTVDTIVGSQQGVITAIRNSNVAATRLQIIGAYSGVFADRGSIVDVGYNGNFELTGGFGLKATRGATINADNIVITGADEGCIIAEDGSKVSAPSCTLANTSNAAIMAKGASTVAASGANITNDTYGAYAQEGSTVDLGSSAVISLNGGRGLFAKDQSSINAHSVNITGFTNSAAVARRSSSINVNSSILQGASGNASNAVDLQALSNINASAANISNCKVGIMGLGSCTVDATESTVSASDEAISLNRGSNASASNATLTSTSTSLYTIKVERGSIVDAAGVVFQSTSTELNCNIDYNTPTRNGIIFG